MNKLFHYLGLLPLCWAMTHTYAQAEERSMIVLDASGSMWGKIEDKTKIVIARDALKSLIVDWPAERQVGLVVYGHRSKGECSDIETVLPVGKLDAKQMAKIVDEISPKGKTPLSAAVKQAAEALKYTEDKATVILLSDGKETCDRDPCALGTELEKLGVDFTAHVIGFDVNTAEDQAGLKCLAENTGGKFISAANAKELNAALQQTAQIKPAEPELKPEPPKPESTPQASLNAPESAVKGTVLKVGLKADEKLEGHVYLYAKGKDKPIIYGSVRTDNQGAYQPSELRLPNTLGDYELRWQKDDQVYAKAALTITDGEVSLELPSSAIKGSLLKVGLKGTEGLDGHVYLFAKGKDSVITYGPVREDSIKGYKPSELRLPIQVGDYEVKWLSSHKEVLATAPLTISDAEVSLTAPQQVEPETRVTIVLNAPDGLDGRIHLFAEGKDQSISYAPIRADSIKGYKTIQLKMPKATGNYQLKWLTNRNELLTETRIAVFPTIPEASKTDGKQQ